MLLLYLLGEYGLHLQTEELDLGHFLEDIIQNLGKIRIQDRPHKQSIAAILQKRTEMMNWVGQNIENTWM